MIVLWFQIDQMKIDVPLISFMRDSSIYQIWRIVGSKKCTHLALLIMCQTSIWPIWLAMQFCCEYLKWECNWSISLWRAEYNFDNRQPGNNLLPIVLLSIIIIIMVFIVISFYLKLWPLLLFSTSMILIVLSLMNNWWWMMIYFLLS